MALRSWPCSKLLSGCRSRKLRHARVLQIFAALARDELEQLLDNLVAVDAFGFGVEVGDDAVAQRGQRDGRDVFGRDVVAALQHGTGFAAEDQILAGARAGSPAHIVLYELG